MSEQNEKRKPGRPKSEIAETAKREEVTNEDVAKVEIAVGAVSSFWGSIDPKRIIEAVRAI